MNSHWRESPRTTGATPTSFLTEVLRLGIMPEGYIAERELRAVRDLLRRRASLVARRTSLTLSLRNLQLRTKGHCPIPTPRLQRGPRRDLVDLFDDPSEKLTAEIQKSFCIQRHAPFVKSAASGARKALL